MMRGDDAARRCPPRARSATFIVTAPPGRPPTTVAELDVATRRLRLIDVPPDGAAASYVLLRRGNLPLDWALLPEDISQLDAAAAAERVLEAGTPLDAAATGTADSDDASPDVPISVLICTRNRAEGLRVLLEALDDQEYEHFEVVVIDNAPSDDSTRRLVESWPGDRTRYVLAPVAGLSRARNAGVAAAKHGWLAMVDDDEIPDRLWLREAAKAIARSRPDALTGPIMPAQLRSPAQWLFEEYGGHNKGRGLQPFEFGPSTASLYDPLFPLPPFGAGGNMFFSAEAIERIGGFDESLGAGTPTQGAEDTLALSQVMLYGGTVVYEPRVFVWHYHRTDHEGLRKQFFGYGCGLTAFYTVLVIRSPLLLFRLLRLLPRGLKAVFHPRGVRLGDLPPDFPPDLIREKNRGYLLGPWLALRSGALSNRWRTARRR